MTDIVERLSAEIDDLCNIESPAAQDARDLHIASLREILKQRRWNHDMVAKAASGGTLDAYREQGQKMAALEEENERLRERVRDLEQAAQELREAEPVGYVYACGQVSFPATLYQIDDLPDDLNGGLIEAIPLYRHPTRK